jgi:hypothetical protein
VVRALDGTADEPEQAEHERDRCPNTRAYSRIGSNDERKHAERHKTADEVIVRRRSRLGLQERVVEHMEGHRAGRQQKERVLTARDRREAGKTTLRRPRTRCG